MKATFNPRSIGSSFDVSVFTAADAAHTAHSPSPFSYLIADESTVCESTTLVLQPYVQYSSGVVKYIPRSSIHALERLRPTLFSAARMVSAVGYCTAGTRHRTVPAPIRGAPELTLAYTPTARAPPPLAVATPEAPRRPPPCPRARPHAPPRPSPRTGSHHRRPHCRRP